MRAQRRAAHAPHPLDHQQLRPGGEPCQDDVAVPDRGGVAHAALRRDVVEQDDDRLPGLGHLRVGRLEMIEPGG